MLATMAAADSQLTNVSVQRNGNSSTVTISATASLPHNEYRPADTLLLIDFPGATAGKLDSIIHNVSFPGVASYQVHSYRAANGSDIARVELTLAPHSDLRFAQDRNALLVTVAAEQSGARVGSLTKPLSAVATPVSAAASSASSTESVPDNVRPAIVRGVSVVRGRDGMNVEIRASGVLSPKVLTLKSPDRLVIDLANAIPQNRPHQIPVHAADVTAIRMSQFQANPPTTRVVVDLTTPQDYELSSSPDKLTVKLHPLAGHGLPPSVSNNADPVLASAHGATSKTPAMPASGKSSTPAIAAASNTKPQEFIVVEPQYHVVATSADNKQATSNERAAGAAHTLGALPPVEIPLSASSTAASMNPNAMNSAMMQAANQQSVPTPTVTTIAARPASCNTGRYTGEPISVNLKDVDLKDFFRLIHEISGLNVVLDPGVTGVLTIVLDDVPWDQALAIVLQNNSLQCQLSGNVLRVALPETLRKEAEASRATQEAQALAVDRVTVTRYLSYASSKNVVPTLKAFLSKRGDIIADDRTNAVIIQDIPSVLPNIDRLIKELDRKTQEVEIEARVVAATRSFARDIGTQVAFAWGNSRTAIGGAPAVGLSPNTPSYVFPPPYITSPGVSAPNLSNLQPGQPLPSTPATIPLFSNLPAVGPTSGLNFLNLGANYRLDALLTAAEQRGLLKILSRPRVVTQNNIQALVRQGVRIPVVTAAQLGGPPTTTYVDAFLRLQVQPQITAEGTIFLNVDVENTTPDFGRQVQGNPTLITQQATTQVLVADGGTVVIGGVIQVSDNLSVFQVPLLGNIPVFGNLFKRKTVSTSTQELIFFITPRILQT
jgi:type IV pilus assembly protein PilQ